LTPALTISGHLGDGTNVNVVDSLSVNVVDSLSMDLTCAWTSQATSGAAGNTAVGSGDLHESLIMPPTSAVTYTLVCDIAPDTSGTLINTVGVTADQVDANTSNDSATDMDSIVSADLAIALQNDVIGPGPGDAVTLTAVSRGVNGFSWIDREK